MRMAKAFEQIYFLFCEFQAMVNKRAWRYVTVLFSPALWSIAAYRIERFFYLLFGRAWGLLRIVLLPILFITHPWRGNCEIHYTANIGKGLKILHPALGVVISGKTVAGKNLVLTGGNCIGGRKSLDHGDIVLGNNVSLGANAVILGPVSVGNKVRIGAGAVVVKDTGDNVILVGVPAHPVEA
jgi:serine acetyltransferase